MDEILPELGESVKAALHEYAESAPDGVFCSGPAYGRRPVDDRSLTVAATPSADVVLAATDAVLARALEEGVWNDDYERLYNEALSDAPDSVWAQAQSRLAAAVNSGRVTLPEDFLPGP